MSDAKARLLPRGFVKPVVFLAVLAAVTAVFTCLTEHFTAPANLVILLKHVTTISLVGLGLTFVVVTGHADMSFHFISCFAGMTMSFLVARGYSPAVSVAVGCLSGAAVGGLNGVLVGRCKLPDMVATIGLGSIAFGAAYLYSEGVQIFEKFETSGIKQLSDAKWMRLPLPVLITAAAYVGAYLLLHRSKFGRRFYAAGSNPVAARFSGIRVGAYVAAGFVLCGMLAALTNIIKMAGSGKGDIERGLNLLMPAYASVFVGIAVLGRPTVGGTFLGALLIGTMENGFNVLNEPFYVMDLVVGIVLVATIVLSRLDVGALLRRRRLRARMAREEAGP